MKRNHFSEISFVTYFYTALNMISVVPPIVIVRVVRVVVDRRVVVAGSHDAIELDDGIVSTGCSATPTRGPATLLFEFFFTVTSAFVIPRKQDSAAHDVPLVTSGSERGPCSTSGEHFAIVGMIRDGASVPSRMSVLWIVFAAEANGNITAQTRIDDLDLKVVIASANGVLRLSKADIYERLASADVLEYGTVQSHVVQVEPVLLPAVDQHHDVLFGNVSHRLLYHDLFTSISYRQGWKTAARGYLERADPEKKPIQIIKKCFVGSK